MRFFKAQVLTIVCFLMLSTIAIGNDVIEKHANWLVEQTGADYSFAYDVTKYIYQNCDQKIIILSIIPPESDLNPKAIRKKTRVYGLGQIKLSAWRKELIQFKIYRPDDLYDWRKNILAMNYIVNKYYEDSHRNVTKTICKYVGGATKHNAKYRYKVSRNIITLSKIKGGTSSS
jgi:hypothetical protein